MPILRQYLYKEVTDLLWNIKKWGPAYLWYSGVLLQCVIVLIGLQALFKLWDRRPTYSLERKLGQQLSDVTECSALLSGQDFAWLKPIPVPLELKNRRAELIRLAYRNSGSIDLSPSANHIYHVWFEIDVKDLESGETTHFPSRFDQYLEVSRGGKIIKCVAGLKDRHMAAPNLQEVRPQACEKRGWTRRMLCDRGTERCYPLAQCERLGGAG